MEISSDVEDSGKFGLKRFICWAFPGRSTIKRHQIHFMGPHAQRVTEHINKHCVRVFRVSTRSARQPQSAKARA